MSGPDLTHRQDAALPSPRGLVARLSGLRPSQVFWGLFSFAFLQRLLVFLLYQPVLYSDTKSYWRLAQTIQAGWDAYDGTRTPGYPYFLLFMGSNQAAWLAQMACGIAMTLLFFYLGWRLSGKAWLGGLVGLLHTLDLGQLFFESNLLTETITTFWLLVALAGLYWGMEQVRKAPQPAWRLGLLALGLGGAVSIALLIRPLFVFMPPWLFFCLALLWQPQPLILKVSRQSLLDLWAGLRRIWLSLVAFTLPVAVLVGGWVGFIYTRYGNLSLTVMTGYHLVQHTGVFFEYVPDEYADLRDTYLRYRDAQIARTGTQANTIWEAIPEMQKVSGLNFYDLSRVLAGISVNLIREHPDLFVRNVLEGWWLFWRAPVYWSPAALRLPQQFQSLVSGLILCERVLLVVANLVFILTSMLAVFIKKLRIVFNLPPMLWVMAGTIWLTSVVQTLLDHGDNPRFLIPLQSWVVFWLAWVVWQGWVHWQKGLKA